MSTKKKGNVPVYVSLCVCVCVSNHLWLGQFSVKPTLGSSSKHGVTIGSGTEVIGLYHPGVCKQHLKWHMCANKASYILNDIRDSTT